MAYAMPHGVDYIPVYKLLHNTSGHQISEIAMTSLEHSAVTGCVSIPSVHSQGQEAAIHDH